MRLRYDFHIHSCLSPCGDGDMTPCNIAGMAALCGLEAIALTDHNACGNCGALMEAAAALSPGLLVLPGMELCTAEEAHVVCLFPSLEDALAFEAAVRPTLPPVPNRPEIFGVQQLCTAQDEPAGTEELLLAAASGISVDAVLPLCRRYHGTAFPAHIDRPSFSVVSSLGDIPPVGFPAVEITVAGDVDALLAAHREARGRPLLLDSDAHYLDQLGLHEPWIEVEDPSPAGIIAALDGRAPCGWGR